MAVDPEQLVRLDQVERHFTDDRRIGPVTLQMLAGRCVGLVGSNGAGKTTVMKMIVGLERPDRGSVRVQGSPVVAGQPIAGVAGMIEEPRFYPRLSGRDNLAVMCGGQALRRARIDALLETVGLKAAAQQRVAGYSQGMRQRLGIARVLLSDPTVIVFDEPTNGLDPVAIRWFRQLIEDLKQDGRAILLSSHMLHEVQSMCDEFVMLNQGTVVASGEADAIESFGSLEDLYFATISTTDPATECAKP